MNDLADYLGELSLPTDILDRQIIDADEQVAADFMEMHNAAVTVRGRRFATGLALAFLALCEELSRQLPAGEQLDQALTRYPPLTTYPNGRRVNSLVVAGPARQVSLRSFYNKAEHVIINRLRRYQYPSMAPHATQAWDQERAMLDRLLAASPGARRAIAERLWSVVLSLQEFAPQSGMERTPRPFSIILAEYPRQVAGEPTGAALQGLAYGYFTADAPNVILRTDRVRAGSRRSGGVGDVDGWRGSNLVLTVEVKDFRLEERDLSQLDGFLRNLGEYPDATAIVLAASFSDDAREGLEAQGVLTLDPLTMSRNVALWDVPKQTVAVDAVRYFLWNIQRNIDMLNRFERFLRETMQVGASGNEQSEDQAPHSSGNIENP